MKSIQYSAKPRMRVILCNDFGGDPDGMIQLAHHILSPSVEIRAVIGSFFTKDTLFGVDSSADSACSAVRSLLKEMNLSGKFNLLKGSDEPMKDTRTPVMSEGAEFIVKEAMRNDSDLPLFILCGASLTDIASACLINPEIASRLTAVWIGGNIPKLPEKFPYVRIWNITWELILFRRNMFLIVQISDYVRCRVMFTVRLWFLIRRFSKELRKQVSLENTLLV